MIPKDISKNITLKHVSRKGDIVEPRGYVRPHMKGLISVETHVMHKGNWLLRIKGLCYNHSDDKSEHRIEIDYIETNAKLIKKLKIPFKKSNVIGWTKQESRKESKEFNRYSVQAKLGHAFVRKLTTLLSDYWKDEHGVTVTAFYGQRMTGIASKTSAYHLTTIKCQ